MADLTQMIRWNAGFVRGLAQSVLDRAKVIRSTLTPYTSESPIFRASKVAPKKTSSKKSVKKPAAKKAAKVIRKARKANA